VDICHVLDLAFGPQWAALWPRWGVIRSSHPIVRGLPATTRYPIENFVAVMTTRIERAGPSEPSGSRTYSTPNVLAVLIVVTPGKTG